MEGEVWSAALVSFVVSCSGTASRSGEDGSLDARGTISDSALGNADGGCRVSVDCEACCEMEHPAGADVFRKAFYDCSCTLQQCEPVCQAPRCSVPANDTSCASCLANVTAAGSLCDGQIGAAC